MRPTAPRSPSLVGAVAIGAVSLLILALLSGAVDRWVALHVDSAKSIPAWMVDQHLPQFGQSEWLAIKSGMCRSDPPVVRVMPDRSVVVTCWAAVGRPQAFVLTADHEGK